MFKVLIADDESYQRLGMKKIISGLRPEYEIIVSEDGKEALGILQNEEIDIAFIDVVMPHLDGLTVVERLHSLNKNTRLVIVSAHNDFTFAQKALRMGVFDFILKPVEIESLASVLLKVENDIMEEGNKQRERQFLESQLSYSLPVYKGHLLNNWMMGTGKMPELDIDFKHRSSGLVMLVDMVQPESLEPVSLENQTQMYELTERLRQHFQNGEREALVFKVESEQTRIAIVIAADSGLDTADAGSLLAEQAREAIRDMERSYDWLCAFGIGGVVDAVDDNVKYSFRQAETVLKYLFYTGYPAVLSHSGITEKKVQALDLSLKDRLVHGVRELDMEKVCSVIEDIRIQATEGGYIRPQHFMYTLNMWMLDILELYRHVIRSDDFNRLYNQLHTRLHEEKTAAAYTEHLLLTLNHLFALLKGSLGHKHDEALKECIAYLKDNFNKDISLQEAAAQCYLSTSYFSNLFKMHTGTTLNQYILDLRMKRAKELLSTPDIKIYEIAGSLGYQDTKYFHRIFKRYYSMTPQEYKSKLRKTSQE